MQYLAQQTSQLFDQLVVLVSEVTSYFAITQRQIKATFFKNLHHSEQILQVIYCVKPTHHAMKRNHVVFS